MDGGNSRTVRRIFEMFLMNFGIFLLIFVCFTDADFTEKTSDNYGPYTVTWEKYYECRGPKLANLTTYSTALVNESNSFIGAVNITFLQQTRIDDVKMSVYSIRGGKKILLWNYKINRPCQHYAISKVIETKVAAQNCVVKKGTYFCELNFTELIHTYMGSSFFYGEFFFRVVVVSKKGNIICLMFDLVFKKKV